MPELEQANGGEDRSAPSSAGRTRRYRLRRREGRLIVSVEIEQANVNVLLQRGYLSEANRSDLTAIHDAMYLFVSDSFWEARLADQRQSRERPGKGGKPA